MPVQRRRLARQGPQAARAAGVDRHAAALRKLRARTQGARSRPRSAGSSGAACLHSQREAEVCAGAHGLHVDIAHVKSTSVQTAHGNACTNRACHIVLQCLTLHCKPSAWIMHQLPVHGHSRPAGTPAQTLCSPAESRQQGRSIADTRWPGRGACIPEPTSSLFKFPATCVAPAPHAGCAGPRRMP